MGKYKERSPIDFAIRINYVNDDQIVLSNWHQGLSSVRSTGCGTEMSSNFERPLSLFFSSSSQPQPGMPKRQAHCCWCTLLHYIYSNGFADFGGIFCHWKASALDACSVIHCFTLSSELDALCRFH